MCRIRQLGVGEGALARRAVLEVGGRTVGEEYLEGMLANGVNVLLVAEVEESLAGYLYAHWLDRLRRERRQLFIYDLEVGAAFRRQGIGTALMERALGLAKAERADAFLITNHSNEPAVALYEKLGGRAENGDDQMFTYRYDG